MRTRARRDFRRGNASDWVELEHVAEQALAYGGPRRNAELPALIRLHRRLASSLATARAMAAEPGLLRYLEALGARSHLALYGGARPRRDTVATLFFGRIPQAIRRFRTELGLAAGLLLLGAALGWLLVALEPAWFFSFVDADWIGIGSVADRTSTLQARLEGVGTWDPQTLGLGLVGLAAFGLGVAAGAPAVVVLLCAGLGLGASLGLYAERGLLGDYAAWFLPHGIPAVLGVVLCGGAGLALGRAVLFPGRASLGRVGRDVAPLVMGALTAFGSALVVELLARPPWGLAEAIVVVTLAVLFFVFAVGTREATAQVDASELPPGQVEIDRAEARLRFDGPEIAGLQVPLASLGERALALSIDLTLLGLVYLGAARVFDLPLTDWVLVLTLGFALRHVYFVAFEHRWQGATPGKRLLGLRVMARDGRGLDLRSLLVRNLLRDAELVSLLLLVRLVDQISPRTPLPETWVLVVLAFAAIFAVPLLGAERRRLGDFVGDTVVIRTPNVPHLPEDALIACDADTAFTREQLGIYGTHEVRRLAELLDALVVEGEGAYDLASEVARTIAERVGVDPETIRDPEQFLRSFYRAQRARVEHDALRGRR